MLKSLRTSTEADLRLAILECGRICYEQGLMRSNDGNISVRVGENRMLITASGVSKGRMEPEDVLLLAMDGSEVSPVPGRRPSSETPMHVEAYRQRPEMRAVIHAHPSYATALTVAGLDFPNDVLPEVLLGLGEVACAPYSTPSSEQDAEAIRLLIREHDAIMLCQHGSLTVGRNLEEALLKLERVESVAEVFWKAQLLGNVKRLPPEARQQLVVLREKFFKS